MKRSLTIIHNPGDGLGVLARILLDRGYVNEFWCVTLSEKHPAPPPVYDLIISLGGSQSPVADDGDRGWRSRESEFVGSAIQAGAAVLAICLGAQLLALANHAELRRLSEPEIGVQKLRPFEQYASLGDKILLPERAYQWHSFGFTSPKGARILSEDQHSLCQAFMIGPRVLGTQFHPELNRSILESWLVEGCYPEIQKRVELEVELYGEQCELQNSRFISSWLDKFVR